MEQFSGNFRLIKKTSGVGDVKVFVNLIFFCSFPYLFSVKFQAKEFSWLLKDTGCHVDPESRIKQSINPFA